MRIDDVQVELVSVPLAESFGGSSYAAATRNTVIVTVTTDDGVVGRIHAGDERDQLPELGRILRQDLRPQVIGRDATAIEPLWSELLRRSPSAASGADQGLYIHALSCLDTALWDALGKRAGLPMFRLWGGTPEPLPSFVIGGYYRDGKSLHELADEVADYQASGYGGLKLKVGGLTPAEDLDRLAAVRDRVGPDFPIACDANQGWRLDQALAFAEGAAEHGIIWFEEPIVWYEQYRDLARLRDRIDIPICAGQSEHDPAGAVRLIQDGCVDILNYDSSWGGGPTGWRKVSHVAEMAGVTLAHHEEPHISAHLLTTVERRTGAEFFHAERDPVWHRLLTERPQLEDGQLRANDLPGFGLVYDEDFLAKYRIG